MPIPPQRDPEHARTRLTEWLATVQPDTTDIRISEIGGPAATGFSNETLIFDASWIRHGEVVNQSLVARVQPTRHSIFLDPQFQTQYRVMKVLADNTDIPLPRVHWYEGDESWLGAPFFVLGKVEGQAPTDNPPYTTSGWLFESHPQDQERLWWSGIDAMAKIHEVDWRGVGLTILDQPHRGKPGLDQQIAYYEEYFAWASQGRPQPIAQAGLEWVKANRPTEGGIPCLCWGDARIGNILFGDYEARAVLDWEMVTLGQPEQDLAWWLFFDRHFTEGIGAPALPGFPGRDATIARYEELTGRTMENLDFYEVFAAFRYCVIWMRIARMFVLYELLPPDSGLDTNNIATQLMAKILGLPAPS